MTKKEAVESFKRVWMPVVRSTYERNKRADYVARSEAWNRFTIPCIRRVELQKINTIPGHTQVSVVDRRISFAYERSVVRVRFSIA